MRVLKKIRPNEYVVEILNERFLFCGIGEQTVHITAEDYKNADTFTWIYDLPFLDGELKITTLNHFPIKGGEWTFTPHDFFGWSGNKCADLLSEYMYQNGFSFDCGKNKSEVFEFARILRGYDEMKIPILKYGSGCQLRWCLSLKTFITDYFYNERIRKALRILYGGEYQINKILLFGDQIKAATFVLKEAAFYHKTI